MTHFRRPIGIMLLFLFAVPLLSACGAFNLISVSPQREASATLAGTAWVFLSFHGPGNAITPAIPGSRLTLAFEPGGKANGFAGCNRFFADYAVAGETVTVSALGVGGERCNAAVMAQETAFLDGLKAASGFSIQHMNLSLRHGNQRLYFADFQAAPRTVLSDTRWQLSNFFMPSLGKRELLDGSRLTLRFTDDGRVTGFAGCNSFSGAYAVNGNGLQFSQLARSTDIPCKVVVREQEDKYLGALAQAKTFQVRNGAVLAVTYTSGQEMHFALQR